jgi:innexin
MEFVKVAKKFGFGSQRAIRDNDFFSDRLLHRHTTKIILVFILLATFKRFFQSPINCWVPAELRRYERYMNKYCWIRGTYYAEQHYDLNMLSIEARQETLLHYYQWVSFFLIVQAFLFYAPRIIWVFITQRILDYDLFNMVDAAMKHECYSFDQNRLVKYIIANLTQSYESAYTIERFNKASRVQRLLLRNTAATARPPSEDGDTQPPAKTLLASTQAVLTRNILTLTYVTVKLIYLLVAVLQIVLMFDKFLSNSSHTFYGGQVLSTILSGQADLGDKSDSKVFPRISVCDVRTRELGTDHVYTIQCVLSFNLFNERIYAFLWFWIFCVCIPFTLIDILGWFVRLIINGAKYRYRFVKFRLKIFYEKIDEKEKLLLRIFTENYLANDGIFVLRLLEHNSNAAVVADVVKQMWIDFRNEHNLKGFY